jgi:hypothetical protein
VRPLGEADSAGAPRQRSGEPHTPSHHDERSGKTTIGGLPAHILLVYAVVVLVPPAALLIVLVTT